MSTSNEVTSEQEKLSKAKERAQDQLLAEVAAFVLEDDDGRPDEPGWFTGMELFEKVKETGISYGVFHGKLEKLVRSGKMERITPQYRKVYYRKV